MKHFSNLLRDESGATAIEYGLIAALVSIAAIVGLKLLGGQLQTTFNNVGEELQKNNTVKGG